MKMPSDKGKVSDEIPTSSMADIAFLLLIFFLVTTTMDTDAGILRLLPPIVEDMTPPDKVKQRLAEDALTTGHAKVLLGVEIEREQELLAERTGDLVDAGRRQATQADVKMQPNALHKATIRRTAKASQSS